MSSTATSTCTNVDENVEIWRFKRLLKSLQNARGNGTSMISLIIPPKKQISEVARMLAEEEGTASNIKSRVNRLSVLSAITSGLQKLKLYNKVPKNGLVIYCGTAMTEDGKEKKLNIDFEPFKPVNTFLYYCDSKFHTDPLEELLESDAKYGFIIMDGNGTLFGTLAGNNREILQKFSVELPKKHGRGGQSALRFSRLREEKRHNYVRKVSEHAVLHFITNDKINVKGLVLGGSADFKTVLAQSEMFDKRLKSSVLKEVDVAYGGEPGFSQAIELSSECLQNVKFNEEKKLIRKFMSEVGLNSSRYCFGIEDTFKGLEMGAVETLIVWENFEMMRYELRKPGVTEPIIKHLEPAQETQREHFLDDGYELEVIDRMPLLEWLAENYKSFGTTLEIISNKSEEGTQFVCGFGGIGGLLRYKVDFDKLRMFGEEDDYLSDSEYF